jgi:hypothetical protein
MTRAWLDRCPIPELIAYTGADNIRTIRWLTWAGFREVGRGSTPFGLQTVALLWNRRA